MNPEPYYKLWAAVFLAAIADIDRKCERPYIIHWLGCGDKTPGSFLWLCSVFDLDPTKAAAKLSTRTGRREIREALT